MNEFVILRPLVPTLPTETWFPQGTVQRHLWIRLRDAQNTKLTFEYSAGADEFPLQRRWANTLKSRGSGPRRGRGRLCVSSVGGERACCSTPINDPDTLNIGPCL